MVSQTTLRRRHAVKINDATWNVPIDENLSLLEKHKDILWPGGVIVLRLFQFLREKQCALRIEELDKMRLDLESRNFCVLASEDSEVFLKNQSYVPEDWQKEMYNKFLFAGSSRKFGDGFEAHDVTFMYYLRSTSKEWVQQNPTIENYPFFDYKRDRIVCAVRKTK